MEKTARELTPEVCGECGYFHEERYGNVHTFECKRRAPLFTNRSPHAGVYPHVNWDNTACGEAVAKKNIVGIRNQREIDRKILGMASCRHCNQKPYTFHVGDRHPEINCQPLDDDGGLYMWCPYCNTIAKGATFDEMVDAWNRGDVENYDSEAEH